MQGDSLTSIEAPTGKINDVCAVKNSGLVFMALDSPRIPSFFIPSLGPAPRWCSFLENLTVSLKHIFIGNASVLFMPLTSNFVLETFNVVSEAQKKLSRYGKMRPGAVRSGVNMSVEYVAMTLNFGSL